MTTFNGAARPHLFVCILVLALEIAGLTDAQSADNSNYDALISLFKEFRAFIPPTINSGVPDYSDSAMAEQKRQLSKFQLHLADIDDSNWPIYQRVDYMLVLAEMRGFEFQHKVVQPWKRDPAFYSTTDLGFGPKMVGAAPIPELPLSDLQALELEQRLESVPDILVQARRNLTDARGDLARLAIEQKGIERNVYARLALELDLERPSVARAAEAAADATNDFIVWLEQIVDSLPPHGGMGLDNYNWLLRYVLLFPYSWEEMQTLGQREYERSMVFLKLEEHRNIGIPMIEPAMSMEEFERRRAEADAELLSFLSERNIMTVPEWLVAPVGEGPYILPADRDPMKPGPFATPIDRHFFRQTEDRDPRPLRAHNLPGHLFDSLSLTRDTRPIRGEPRLFFIGGTRAEGWAFYLEEMIQQTGFLEDRPKTREINYILQAKRAARILPELKLHELSWTYDEALASLTSRTPYWMGPNDPIARFDLELYLRQPGYGIGYYMGKVQLESLFAEIALQLGSDFNLKSFHDEFLAEGNIPISLIRWEMTGNSQQIRDMRNAPPLETTIATSAD